MTKCEVLVGDAGDAISLTISLSDVFSLSDLSP